jgi:plastocyanin
VLLLLVMLPAALPEGSALVTLAEAQQANAAARTVTVLVGGGQDTIVLDSFFPQTVRVRVGDTVVWKFNGDETHHFHTVTLFGGPFDGPKRAVVGGGPGEVIPPGAVPVPGGQPGERMRNPVRAWPTRKPAAPSETYDGTTYVNSGEMRKRPRAPGMPAFETFSLTFTKPGTYRYVCAAHPHMQGTIEVMPAEVVDVPSQAEIDKQAEAEAAHLLALIEKAKGLGKTVRSEPGPNGTTFWFVRAGAFDTSGEMRGQLFDFLLKTLTVKAGDTAIWESVDIHTITFNPMPPSPDPHIVKAQADGPPLLLENPKVFQPSKPAPVYDPAQYFNSALLGMTQACGTSWALTFDTPGVYEYFSCSARADGHEGDDHGRAPLGPELAKKCLISLLRASTRGTCFRRVQMHGRWPHGASWALGWSTCWWHPGTSGRGGAMGGSS